MKKIQFTGNTLEEAIQYASIKLQVVSDNIGYDIIQEGKKGIFGFGSRKFIIEAFNKEVENDHTEIAVEETVLEISYENKELPSINIEQVKEVINEIAVAMNLSIIIKDEILDDACVKIDILGNNLNELIGKDGNTMDSIQYIASRIASKNNDKYVKVKLDIDGYREKRRKNIKEIAEKTANNVIENLQPVKLKAMNAYERRIVHAALQSDKRVKTSSIGSEPYRCVVVSLVK